MFITLPQSVDPLLYSFWPPFHVHGGSFEASGYRFALLSRIPHDAYREHSWLNHVASWAYKRMDFRWMYIYLETVSMKVGHEDVAMKFTYLHIYQMWEILSSHYPKHRGGVLFSALVRASPSSNSSIPDLRSTAESRDCHLIVLCSLQGTCCSSFCIDIVLAQLQLSRPFVWQRERALQIHLGSWGRSQAWALKA